MKQFVAALSDFWAKILAFLPSLLAAAVILLVAFIITKLTEGPIAAMLKRSKFVS